MKTLWNLIQKENVLNWFALHQSTQSIIALECSEKSSVSYEVQNEQHKDVCNIRYVSITTTTKKKHLYYLIASDTLLVRNICPENISAYKPSLRVVKKYDFKKSPPGEETQMSERVLFAKEHSSQRETCWWQRHAAGLFYGSGHRTLDSGQWCFRKKMYMYADTLRDNLKNPGPRS